MWNKIKMSSYFIMLLLFMNISQAYVLGDCEFKDVKAQRPNQQFSLYITAALTRQSIDHPPWYGAIAQSPKYRKINLKVDFYFMKGGEAISYLIDNKVWDKDINIKNFSGIAWSYFNPETKQPRIVYPNDYVEAVQYPTNFDIVPGDTIISDKGGSDVVKSIGDSEDWKISRISGNEWKLTGVVYDDQGNSIMPIKLYGKGTCTLKMSPTNHFTAEQLEKYGEVSGNASSPENKTEDK